MEPAVKIAGKKVEDGEKGEKGDSLGIINGDVTNLQLRQSYG